MQVREHFWQYSVCVCNAVMKNELTQQRQLLSAAHQMALASTSSIY